MYTFAHPEGDTGAAAVRLAALWVMAALMCGCAGQAELERLASNPDLGESLAPAPPPGGPAYPENRHPDLTPPPLEWAIVQADNDCSLQKPYVRPGSRLVRLPDAVRKKICEVTLEQFRSTAFEGPTQYAHLFGPVFRIQAPDRATLHLYVYRVLSIMTEFNMVLLLHNTRTGQVTPRPVVFSGRWLHSEADVLLQRPYVSFDDLDLDGRAEVVFQERVHNGTERNAVWYQYLSVGDDLSLTPIFTLETRMSPGYDLRRLIGDGYVIRTIEKPAPNRILMRSRLADKPSGPGDREAGYVVLESPDARSPFRVKEKVVRMELYRRLLLNLMDDEVWLPDY